jgi:hypothetical protein
MVKMASAGSRGWFCAGRREVLQAFVRSVCSMSRYVLCQVYATVDQVQRAPLLGFMEAGFIAFCCEVASCFLVGAHTYLVKMWYDLTGSACWGGRTWFKLQAFDTV